MITIPPMILGTFQNDTYKNLLNVIRSAVENGITGFDTAPSYNTEELLGRALKVMANEFHLKRESFFVSDKVDAWQMQAKNGDVSFFIENALKKIQIEYFDLLLIHWPIEEYLSQTWESMQSLQIRGLVKQIGICNVRKRHLEVYRKKNIIPHYIQIERHPLRTCKEEMDYCKEHQIKVLSYSPICRMHQDLRGSLTLKALAEKYKKNIGQIILRWHIDTNAVPIFMSTKSNRIKENTNIFDFKLNNEEVESINSLNQNYKIFLESWGSPGF